MKRSSIAVGAIAILSLPLNLALADTPGRSTPQTSMNDARVTALRQVPGTVIAEELERENGKTVYSFEIKPTAGNEANKEVKVDGETGAVSKVETADDETQDADKDHEEEDDD
jgi:hypothetical protein